ncbi:MAG: hypothetical protein COZ06_16340 [Armatimonadetes bacterium CG_4_10_14_3_um_filter_66_18]|nr:MAG: hypothetical protein AUJ96_16690 [Armatimonadetes bacterium CG2_30_66_41]PIU94476.1 MAG: hypothetical protein COS65_07430 [Armatimonadetes bacterium CG06_land_8_20_14_3_00_66_21]PIX45636.1 MAG: hypothetical protein COZ57_14780 [Armatimonadetes bacterium CG_4_8_14_3_um_filter_66_20]PIY48517.1 MAG: hypothetical protein COZ06_16340 [Armatimonadetes bacterium CG_4_10_14_3_um_filter_66_18]PIZ49654.1 MAG: hypothetical protein COY42_03525 [Armatimonadetes bacterium CG_4_10_14_0_8_um_filter_66_
MTVQPSYTNRCLTGGAAVMVLLAASTQCWCEERLTPEDMRGIRGGILGCCGKTVTCPSCDPAYDCEEVTMPTQVLKTYNCTNEYKQCRVCWAITKSCNNTEDVCCGTIKHFATVSDCPSGPTWKEDTCCWDKHGCGAAEDPC